MRFPWLTFLLGCVACIGALNWGAVGLFDTNIVRSIFGGSKTAERTVYSVVGLSGLFLLFNLIMGNYINRNVNVNLPGTINVPGREPYEP